MTKVEPIPNESVEPEKEELREKLLSQTWIDRILQKLSGTELPAKDSLEENLQLEVVVTCRISLGFSATRHRLMIYKY